MCPQRIKHLSREETLGLLLQEQILLGAGTAPDKPKWLDIRAQQKTNAYREDLPVTTSWKNWLPIVSIENIDLFAMPRAAGERIRTVVIDYPNWIQTAHAIASGKRWERVKPARPKARHALERERRVAKQFERIELLAIADLESDPRLAHDALAFDLLIQKKPYLIGSQIRAGCETSVGYGLVPQADELRAAEARRVLPSVRPKRQDWADHRLAYAGPPHAKRSRNYRDSNAKRATT